MVKDTPANPGYNPELILDPKGLGYDKWNATIYEEDFRCQEIGRTCIEEEKD